MGRQESKPVDSRKGAQQPLPGAIAPSRYVYGTRAVRMASDPDHLGVDPRAHQPMPPTKR